MLGLNQRSGAGQRSLGPRPLQLLEMAFNGHATDNKVEAEALSDILRAGCGRFLDREIEELQADHESDGGLTFQDVRGMVLSKEPFITSHWRSEIAKSKQDADDVFQQLFQAQKVLANSCGGPEGGVDLHDMEYILSTCGEEVDHEAFDELLNKIKHPRKGQFEMQKLVMYLGGLLEEVGLEGSEQLAKDVVKRIEQIGKPVDGPPKRGGRGDSEAAALVHSMQVSGPGASPRTSATPADGNAEAAEAK